MIEIIKGVWLIPEDVKVVKRISEYQCAFWITGQSALEGFVVDCSAEDFMEVLEEAIHGENVEDDYEDENSE